MIYVCGEALIDMLPSKTTDGEISFVPHTGGSPFNTCIAAARLDVPVSFLGRLSNDFFGQMLSRSLTDNGVDLSVTQRGNEPTTLGFVKVEQGKDPEYAFYTNGTADCSFSSEEIPDQFSDDVMALAFGSISLIMEPGATAIENLAQREKGKRVLSFDPNIRPVLIENEDSFRRRCERLLKFASIVKISDVDLKWLYPDLSLDDAAFKVQGFGPLLVVVTKGADGSFALRGTLRVDSPAVHVEVSDTVGAGDTFHAGFLAWLYRNGLLTLKALSCLSYEQLTEALHFASSCAAVTCSRPGADPPFWEEVNR